jgi:hypothetical protein
MQDADAIIRQQVAQLVEKLRIIPLADMLEHADRDDAVERSLDFAIVAQVEADFRVQPGGPRTVLADAVLFDAQRHTGHVAACLASEMKAKAAPTGPDVQHLEPWTVDIQLGGQQALLLDLRPLQAHARLAEIGTGILHIVVQKEAVQLLRQVVVMGDVPARPLYRIVPLDPASQTQKCLRAKRQPMLIQADLAGVADQQVQEIVKAAVLDADQAVHIGLRQADRRVQGNRPVEMASLEP